MNILAAMMAGASATPILFMTTLLSVTNFGADAFYVPGITAADYKKGDEVTMSVNSLTSIKTQLPFGYNRLPLCKPRNINRKRENIGELLAGDRIIDSPYHLQMQVDVNCKILCAAEPLDEKTFQRYTSLVERGYHHNFILDNLPGATQFNSETEGAAVARTHYAGGFPVGYADPNGEDRYVFNHLRFHVKYHQKNKDVAEYRVVQFSVDPMSVEHIVKGGKTVEQLRREAIAMSGADASSFLVNVKLSELIEKAGVNGCSDKNSMVKSAPLKLAEHKTIIYSYDVVWEESDILWATRWDIYLSENNIVPAQVHWFAITNSIMVVVILSVMIALILVRNLRRDIAGYNEVLTDEEKLEEQEESGW
eukprot:CAMPEP_0113308130 /NCGR_PEP_ID=MMETSP0010_2-20120614/6689_1 /TAXON_ID=216773 ORGANISM="Corethron hystrix, Strain 308" /NCGR_SAMPLE_ID=MMETSP0010_2 /ASSEMBLY_ACC=CAM_ASM_000155 /LENGTH=364 /DNA_ID=CAMNT_0000163105 /DNA_START=168 /DNA_END=1259 /DNA_ORIENTATION=+ /assembly_acc=CAM_ASM_000155